MRLDPGAIRELHWHALAAEWGYVLTGRCRTTVITPCWASTTAIFPNSARLASRLDCSHAAQRPGAFAQMPEKGLYIGPGRVPPAEEEIRNSELQPSQSVHKFRMGKMPAKTFEGGEERIVTSNEFPIQMTITANRMDLKPGALRELHWHPHADEWQFYVREKARVTIFGVLLSGATGHYIEQIRDDLSNRLGGNPHSLLTSNFGLSRRCWIACKAGSRHYR
jgi:oxalate decarboxylase